MHSPVTITTGYTGQQWLQLFSERIYQKNEPHIHCIYNITTEGCNYTDTQYIGVDFHSKFKLGSNCRLKISRQRDSK